MWDAYAALPVLDAGKPVVLIGGIHAGCYELFATSGIHGVRDLKGKTVAVYALGQGAHVLVASMLAYVGMNPSKDVHWVAGERAEDAMRLFVEGKADAFIGFPPHPQELRRKKIGHVILDTSQDRPWSQYFCCMLGANRDFAHKIPGRDQAGAARLPESGRHLRRGARAGCPLHGGQGLRAALRGRATKC